jgi:alkylation response protein AidB-like acyl-CoA dehydrogenase
MERGLYEEDHELFREVAVEFNSREVAPHYQQWAQEHLMARKLWNAAGEQGLLGLAVPEEFPSPTAASSCSGIPRRPGFPGRTTAHDLRRLQ